MKKMMSLKAMDSAEQERGAVLLWFAAMAVALLGTGSLVVDAGALWSERRQLQNGADAAALAVAADCAFSTCTNPMSMAKQYADYNAQDGGSNVDLLCGNAPGLSPCSPVPPGAGTYKYVHVKTSTWSTSGDNQVRYIMAPILDAANVGKTVTASATVAWGSLTSANVIALVLSKCAFDPAWINPDGSTNFPGTPIVARFDPKTNCGPGNFPEGFDFVSSNDKTCTTSVSLLNGEQVLEKSSEGNSPTCKKVLEEAVVSGLSILIPIVVARTSPGGNTYYTVDGFASVELCGYRMPGSNLDNCKNPDGTVSTVCSDQTGDKICGIFRPKTVTEGDIGSGTDYGTRIIKMVG